MANYWLMKSEPQVYSIDDLETDEKTIWDGIRNYQARNFLRQMKKGDPCFFYHSNVTPPGIVGLMRVSQGNIIDPTQFDPSSAYYDSSATVGAPRWQTVEVEFVAKFEKMIDLSCLKQQFNPDEFLLIRRGNRLSVMPVEEQIAARILDMSQIDNN